ncbi:MAG: M23 family metallopeptidase [Treponema sp.]|jgi:murein DD-endopeptidase MepM/ murein hydrolase activator NlpD|nr:M23 family metallopeptidase [Treponema sp.]
MVTLLANQHVSKRQKKTHSRLNNKSACFNSEFMSQFRQKPLYNKKKKKTEKPWYHNTNNSKIKKHDNKPKFSGFSFPIPSFATLLVIAATVVIAVTSLNWENINIKPIDISAFGNSESINAGQLTIQYAATGISNIMAAFAIPDENTVPGIETEEIDNPHGMLINFEWREYKVQRGDVVSRIAERHGVSIGAIIASNNITNARRLQEGQILRIPNIDGIPYQVKRDDNLSRIAASFNVPLDVILDVNDIKSDNIRLGETLFIPGARMNDIDLRRSLGDSFMFPLQGRRIITSNFGWRRDPKTGVPQIHDGIDFRANTGTPVLASLDGVVSVVRENRLYGKHIIITHSNGFKTLYGHLNTFSVREGDRVARGRKIGESGNTGYSTGPHLHFGIYDRNNRAINPLDLLN